MNAYFAIIEVEDGLTIVQVAPGQSPEDAALAEGGVSDFGLRLRMDEPVDMVSAQVSHWRSTLADFSC